MSFPTEPVFVPAAKGWDANLLKHPVMRFMHAYEISFAESKEMLNAPFGVWHTPDFEYVDATGVSSTGEHGLQMQMEMYKLVLDDFYHEPAYVYINETKDGYACYGQAFLYVNFKVPATRPSPT